MDYKETLEYLYNTLPMFQQIGGKALKEGLVNTIALDKHFHHPHKRYKTIHVGGTNGKGSVSHTLAAILQAAGYRTGLYTSPHLMDFRERIRVNGKPISENFIVDFVEQNRSFFEPLCASFFEVTTSMAFKYFADERVDVAVIEVGLGGRLDCTNVITPDLSVITNVSFDHVQFLGNALDKIAYEKAGIIKQHTPVVIGESTDETRPVFEQTARSLEAHLILAEEEKLLYGADVAPNGGWIYQSTGFGTFRGELGGLSQLKNTNTILSAVKELQHLRYWIETEHVRKGFSHVAESTGLLGRWQKLGNNPTVICDTAHNVAGMSDVVKQLLQMSYKNLHIVLGFVNDKDVTGILSVLPIGAIYYFTKADIPRALDETELQILAGKKGLTGIVYPDVVSAVRAARRNSLPEDLIFIGGSNFVVADLLTNCDALDFDRCSFG